MKKSIPYLTIAAVILGIIAIADLVPRLASGAYRPPTVGDRYLIGFWEGVDDLDGSTIQLSIADFDRNHVLDYRYRESFFSFCFDPVTNSRGRGYDAGTVTANSTSDIHFLGSKSECLSDDNSVEVGAPFDFTARYEAGSDILVLTQGDNVNYLHRTSDPLGFRLHD